MAAPFTTLFWNVWVESQVAQARLQKLRQRLDGIIKTNAPDVIGLNEVLVDRKTGASPLIKHLEAHGYQTLFAPFSPEKEDYIGGSVLATRVKPSSINVHELGPDRYGQWRGHPGHTIKLIYARIPHGTKQINVVVNYLAHLMPYNWPTHIKHHKAFRLLMKDPELQQRTIIGGDFNQLKFMPRLWGSRAVYHRATGSFTHPTWKFLGKLPIIQANLDNIFWTKCGEINLEEFTILERWPSDHAPLLARFSVNP